MNDGKTTLLILAAGMGSRYGGLKQLDDVGPGGETIIDYSLYDALEAGFNKFVFIIREEFKSEFEDKITSKINDKAEVHLVSQAINTPIEGVDVNVNREKPWGTGHAVLVAKDVINEPFAVINADDFYGRDAFKKAYTFLNEKTTSTHHGIIGYILKNTLSDNGYVSRGVCEADDNMVLTSINERTKVEREGDKVYYEQDGQKHEVDENSIVSMNFWAFHPSVFDHLLSGFKLFAMQNTDNPKAEYFIPLVAEALTKSDIAKFEVVTCDDKWFGVTYKEDKPDVQEELSKMVDNGVYPNPLW